MSATIMAAISIAKAVGLDDWILDKLSGNDSAAAKLASKVVKLATVANGGKEVNADVLQADPDLAFKVRQSLINNAHELALAPYRDRQSAREMHKVNNEQADRIAERIMRENLYFTFAMIIANGLAVYFLSEQAAILATISNVLGMAIKSLFDERKEVTGFFFGSSMGSKTKEHNLQEK